MESKVIDWQGHRGARAALPENTIPAFLYALQFPYIQTLELDVVISADEQVIVSHEPYFSHHISTHPNGKAVTESEAPALNIYKMTVEEIQSYDVGSRGNKKFPSQQPMAINKPRLIEMLKAVEDYCLKTKRKPINYNIEIKSRADAYGEYFPQPKKFVSLVLDVIKNLKVMDRCNLQSFDTNILEEIHLQAPEISNALLVEHLASLDDHLATISFQPTNYSPYFEFLTEGVVMEAHAKGIKVVPWTVNELKDMQRMVDIGVDGIITDYVGRPRQLLEKPK